MPTAIYTTTISIDDDDNLALQLLTRDDRGQRLLIVGVILLAFGVVVSDTRTAGAWLLMLRMRMRRMLRWLGTVLLCQLGMGLWLLVVRGVHL